MAETLSPDPTYQEQLSRVKRDFDQLVHRMTALADRLNFVKGYLKLDVAMDEEVRTVTRKCQLANDVMALVANLNGEPLPEYHVVTFLTRRLYPLVKDLTPAGPAAPAPTPPSTDTTPTPDNILLRQQLQEAIEQRNQATDMLVQIYDACKTSGIEFRSYTDMAANLQLVLEKAKQSAHSACVAQDDYKREIQNSDRLMEELTATRKRLDSTIRDRDSYYKILTNMAEIVRKTNGRETPFADLHTYLAPAPVKEAPASNQLAADLEMCRQSLQMITNERDECYKTMARLDAIGRVHGYSYATMGGLVPFFEDTLKDVSSEREKNALLQDELSRTKQALKIANQDSSMYSDALREIGEAVKRFYGASLHFSQLPAFLFARLEELRHRLEKLDDVLQTFRKSAEPAKGGDCS